MNFGELCAEVMVLTNRPELVAETQSRVRAATTYLHLFDFWLRDADEKIINFPASSTVFQIDTKVAFTNYRKLRYIRKWDPTTLLAGEYIKSCAPDCLYDEFKQKKSNVYYQAGNLINLLTSENQSAFVAGWYRYPNTGLNNYSSWIAELVPYAIIDLATGWLLTIIGQVEEGNKYTHPQNGSVFTMHIPSIRINDVEPEAR